MPMTLADPKSKAQQHTFSKTMHELESRRLQMEEERWELLSKVNHLAGEVRFTAVALFIPSEIGA
jgi:hypothetical protein